VPAISSSLLLDIDHGPADVFGNLFYANVFQTILGHNIHLSSQQVFQAFFSIIQRMMPSPLNDSTVLFIKGG